MKIPGLHVPVSEKSAKNTNAAKGKPSLEAKVPLRNTANVNDPRLIKTSGNNISQSKIPAAVLMKSLGLPADRLSSSILSFARLFSLPLEPGFLSKIRRQALSAGQTRTEVPGRDSLLRQNQADPTAVKPESGLLPKGRESLAFAALAAASKGLELSATGLAEYAAAMEPDSYLNSGRRKKQDSKGNRQEEAEKQENLPPRPKAEVPLRYKNSAISTDGPLWFKNMILLEEERNPLLRILNKLPGKNGQRWLALPFSFEEQGDEYRLCLKILLNEGANHVSGYGRMAGQMALDIVKNSPAGSKKAGKNEHWLFFLDSENNKNLRLRVCLEPTRPKRVQKSLISGLSEIMQIAPERITIQNFADYSLFEEENQKGLLLYVNEEV